MQFLYRNEKSPLGPWLITIAGPVLMLLVMLQLTQIFPLFDGKPLAMWLTGLVGVIFETFGFVTLMKWVKSIGVPAASQLVVTTAIGKAELAGGDLQTLRIHTRGKDEVSMTLGACGRSWSFPTTSFAADRIAESLKAMNAGLRVERTA